MSFEGQKNSTCPPPWQRNSQQISSLQTLGLGNQALVTYAQNQPVYNTNIAMAQQPQASQQQTQNIPLISQISSQLPSTQIFTQTVSYPTPRALNPIAFNQQPISSTPQSHQNQAHHCFNGIGVVTKVQNDVGFIDKEVFFNKNACVKGIVPKVGDRVLVEVTYNQNMPFKWNATRVQLTSSGGPGLGLQTQNRNVLSMSRSKSSSGYGNVPPPPSLNGTNFSRSHERSRNLSPTPSQRSMEKLSSRSRDPRIREMEAKAEEEERKRRPERERELREKEKRSSRHRDRDRDRKDSTPDRRERSPPRRSPPKKRRARAIPRYMVQVPKSALTVKEADMQILKLRYNNLYIPSDFFYSNIKWPDAFPPHVPFSINKPCSFHIMRKDVEPVICGELPAEPEDVDYLFSAKVMLMASPPMEEMYKKCITTAEEREDDDRDVVHPSRLINFLVGIRGKNEAMAIGGPWSPSLDGENPQSDVSVLIRTAIRTCKSLTGIDLSNCTQWYRFVELYYRRGEVSQKGRVIPPRIETVVIFLPDIRSCIPTRPEWDALHAKYKRALDRILRQEDDENDDEEKEEEETKVVPPPPPPPVPSPPTIVEESLSAAAGVDEMVVVGLDAASATDAEKPQEEKEEDTLVPPSAESAEVVEEPLPENITEPVVAEMPKPEDSSASADKNNAEEEGEEQQQSSTAETAAPADSVPDDDGAEISSTEKDENPDEDAEMSKVPTHHSLLDLKTMKIQEIRDELEARNVSSKGLKAQLAARLAKILKTEASDEESKDQEEKSEEEVKESTEEETKPEEKTETTSEEVKEPEVEKVVEEEQPQEEKKEPEDDEKEDGEIIDDPEPEKPEITEEVTLETSMELSTKEDQDIVEILEASDAAFNDGGDYSDLVIIEDEEMLKPLTKPTKPKKEKKPLDEREKQALEKKYTLPETPQLIVHPSKVAKNGKFDCTMMSLSLLLDYRPEDTKEHSFEISLFAELFNEMLMRDFGYNIYKALSMVQERTKESSSDGKKDPSAERTAEEISTKKELKDEKDEESSKSKKYDKDSRSDRDRSRHRDESDDDAVSVRSGEKRKRDKDRQKPFTAHPDLLLSFVYFDQTHCGYIFEKDIEDLFHSLGLNLSRAQVRKLVGKSISRDSLYYRKLTDSTKEVKEDGTIEVIEDFKKEDLSDDVLQGNKFYLPVFKDASPDDDETDEPPLKKIKTEEGEATSQKLVALKNGGVVDVEKLLLQMARSEKALEDTEKLLIDARKQVAELQASNSKANSKIKDLSSDLKAVTRKLNDTEVTLSSTQKKCGEFHAVLSTVQDRVSSVLARNEKHEKGDKTADKSEKSEKASVTEEKKSHRSDSRSRDDRKDRSKSATPKKDD